MAAMCRASVLSAIAFTVTGFSAWLTMCAGAVAQQAAATNGVANVQAAALQPRAHVCGPDALGTARTVVIDTSGGQLFGRVQYKDNDFLGPKEIVLTFDDGPSRAYTLPILQALSSHCTRATFFMVGRMALSDPEMVKEVARRGHTVGTHTWSHNLHLGRSSPSRVREEVELGISAVSLALGRPVSPFFRFPFLSDSRAAIGQLRARDHGIFSIDIDSLDFREKSSKGPANVIRRVLRTLEQRGKGIILFHDIQPSTARALPTLLAELKRHGYKVVHVVPKSAGSTVAEFDKAAARYAGTKRYAALRNPLAVRSLTWSMDTKPVTPTNYQAPSAVVGQPQAQQVPPPRPALRGRIDDDWRTKAFSDR